MAKSSQAKITDSASVDLYLSSDNPVTREAALFLVDYKEEDDRVDYKLAFDPQAEKHWLEITKDVSAFANTFGGYLVFGVDDVSREIVGLKKNLAEELEDVNNIQQKLNRHLEPHMENVRSKKFRVSGKLIALLYVPQSFCRTHIISKDGSFRYPSGKLKTVLRKGTFYIRRSAGNHLGDSRDLEAVIERRVNQFRDALMDKVARVVSSPMESEVFILSQDQEDMDSTKFVIEDSPESIPIRGMSFTVTPKGPEEEIATWCALSRGESSAVPPAETVWSWYAIRETLQISAQHRLSVFRFSLWTNVPAFYWIQGLFTQDIQQALLGAVRHRRDNDGVPRMLAIASFIGRSFYVKVLRQLGTYRKQLAPRQKSYPDRGPKHEYFKFKAARKQTEKELRRDILQNINEIANKAATDKRVPGLQNQWKAQNIDCYLYSQDDQYKRAAKIKT